MQFTVSVEAEGYGSPEDEAEALLDHLPEELPASVGVDEERGMIRTTMVFDAANGWEAHEQAKDLWGDAWEAAFSASRPPMRLAIIARPFDPEQDAELLEERETEPTAA